MNRTLTPLNGASLTHSQIVPSQNIANWFDRQKLALPAQRSTTATAHSCFAPMHYESGYAYPLIVWLHGPDSNEDELRQVMPLISTRNQVAIAPRGTGRVESGVGAYRWDDSVDGIAEAGERVADCIAIAKQRFNIHPDRIFIAGHSVGGTMAHRLGMEFPEQFAGAISLGGGVPRGSRLLKHINRVRQLPLLLSVSPAIAGDVEGDVGNYSLERVMDDVRFLHCAGLSLSLQLYPAGDELTTVMFEDIDNWVMEQFCPSNASTAS
ncbi:MAG: hypothetical protein GXP24_08420 [Planctomycetes bacterium]|nr:hypothetical protein [Planctomycetota bacterium]